MKMVKMLTNTNRTVANRTAEQIKFIVIHYVGAVSTARNNGKYFMNAYRGASAHYFVDENEVVQVVDNKDIAWSVGTRGKVYNGCYNSNSINVELCCKKTANGAWYFEEQTLRNAVELVRNLLKLYPNAKLCRHYDVTHKKCPAPMVDNVQLWESFVQQCAKVEEPKQQVLFLPPTVERWNVYPLNKKPVVGNEIGELYPKKFGGLEYDILSWTIPNVVCVIRTRDYAEVQIYVGKDTDAVIR